MADIVLKTPCTCCGGTGVHTYIPVMGEPPIVENPCPACEGTGEMPSNLTLDGTLLHNLKDKIKDIDDRTKDIWDKVKDL